VRPDPPRSHEPVTRPVLDRLAEMAREDLAERVARRPRWDPYRERIICVALCQGAAQHFVDGENGVKDLDVWTFFSEDEETGPFPWRWRRERLFDRPPFEGHFADFIGRSLDEPPGADPVSAVRRYLGVGRTPSAKKLAQKAVVLLDPPPLRGTVAWPDPGQ
jgi:hypothetical protein